MSALKCKMCGGDIEINQNQTTGICQYCGTQQTLPNLKNSNITNLYDRANHLRQNNQYDKAKETYEKILDQNPEDSEIYWSILLCDYGIQYVVDPATNKRIPTINRTQNTSIYTNYNYQKALQYADPMQKQIYEKEAAQITTIQKSILEISQKEDPFDIFICYKETDENNKRTIDSVQATDLYYQLTNEGYKVFLSKITLENKLGTAYEPYIYAALQSSKIMVVLGTKKEYFQAVWVRNEWSRYLNLIKTDQTKTLIPVYKDMDPYDLPEEFSHLQALNMNNLGFMQDLIRGINKIIGKTNNQPQPNPLQQQSQMLLKRAYLFLEDQNWEKANQYLEEVLDKDPENPRAYLGKIMLNRKLPTMQELLHETTPLQTDPNYEKILRFADPKIKQQITNINQNIIANLTQKENQIKKEKLQKIYTIYCNKYYELEEKEELINTLMDYSNLKDLKNNLKLIDKNIAFCKKLQATFKKLIDTNALKQYNIINPDNNTHEEKQMMENINNLTDYYNDLKYDLEYKIQQYTMLTKIEIGILTLCILLMIML